MNAIVSLYTLRHISH